MDSRVLLLLLLASCSPYAVCDLQNPEGDFLGSVQLYETVEGVRIAGNLYNLPPGLHAFHVHEYGVCEGDFSSAGGHFNPYDRKHGLLSAEGPHVGDLPNIEVSPDGHSSIYVTAPLASLGSASNSVIGKSLVIHEGPDDYITDPSGSAGPRIACGVIRNI